jgi:flagellar M-ring protein FliF
VGSEFDEQVNYQRALEGELEHTVGSLADVESARVHLVLPHDSLFRDQERPAKASVVLKLRHRNLADGEPEAIRNLVASAVDGLTPDPGGAGGCGRQSAAGSKDRRRSRA